MPFRDVWYYGDVLFIIDPWLWLALGIGWLWSRHRSWRGSPGAERPARIALTLAAVYIAVLWGSKLAATQVAREALGSQGIATGRLMAGPVALNPFHRQIVAEARDGYALGSVDWLRHPPFTSANPSFVKKNEEPGIVQQVTATRPGRIFLHWARFPFYLVEKEPDGGTRVSIVDARYALRPGRGIGSVVVEVAGGEGR